MEKQASRGEASEGSESGLAGHGERRPVQDLILARARGVEREGPEPKLSLLTKKFS